MKLASIERVVQTQPIPGADRIEAVQVLGFWTIGKKGEFKPGDLCVWHNPDTVVDGTNPAYAFLKGKTRLRTIRMRGQISQGLALPVRDLLPDVHGLAEGDEVSELIGIVKYEKPEVSTGYNLRGSSRPSNWPVFLMKTDDNNIQSYPGVLADFIRYDGICVLTKKYDGCSATFYRDSDGNFGVCSRNQELEEGTSVWWDIAKKFRVESLLPNGIAVQGEIVGPGIQGNPLGLLEKTFFVFDIFDIVNQKYWNRGEVENFCAGAGLPVSEVVMGFNFAREFSSTEDQPGEYPKRMRECLEMLLKIADTTFYSPGKPCEGLVLRSVNEAHSRHGSRNRLSAKVMSRVYVEDETPTLPTPVPPQEVNPVVAPVETAPPAPVVPTPEQEALPAVPEGTEPVTTTPAEA